MARPTQRPCRCFINICVSTVLLLLLSQALRHRYQEDRHRRDILDSTEIPAEHIDPAAIDLTPLVNTLINSSQSGSRQLFSLLSVTSYSSLALHKLTLLVYNISSIRSLENNMFRRRFCYCVTNETNDLTDFTAILLDVIGNSTSYLHELFKSASILSVSQKNNSDCIYICVMGGKIGREVPELWQVGSIMPLFNQTIVEGPHRGNISAFRLPVEWHQLPTNLSHMSPSGMSSILTSRVHSTAHVSPTTRDETAATTIKITMAQSPLTAQQPTTAPPQSWTTMDKLGTTRITMTQMVTAQKRTTQMATTQKTTKPTVAAAQLQTTTVLQLTITLPQPTTALLTTSASVTTTTAPPTTRPPQLTTESSVTTAFSPVIVTTRHHATSTGHPIRLSVDGLTAVPVVAQGMTGPPSMRKTTPSETMETERAGCPWRRPELNGKSTLGGYSISTTTVSAHKLQPCVLELCKFFSQCLCRPFNRKMRMKRYCDNSHIWYEKHTSEVCRRVRRVSFSRNLKQRCLTKMCSKL